MLLASTVTACAGSVRLDTKPVSQLAGASAQPPAALTIPCDPPVPLPDSAMSAGAVERGWAQDRVSLMDCGTKHSDLLRFYQDRDAGLAGK